MLFRVGDLAHHEEREPNSELAQAERVSVPATINARLNKDGDFDFFRFTAKKDETWVFDLRAARNGSGLDAALILTDLEGRKIDHDEDTFIWDPFLTHTFAADGDYVAIVQPTHRSNDPGFGYQLDIRRSPHLDTVSPLALRPGTETEVTLHGRALVAASAPLRFSEPGFSGQLVAARGNAATARIRVPADAKPGEVTVRVDWQGLSNPATFLVDETPRYSGAGPLRPPVAIDGTARYRTPERFPFRAEEGQTLTFEVRAMRYGSPVDSVLRILDAQGKAVASNDDANFPGVQFNKDSRISHKFKSAGEYVLEMRNLFATTGEQYPYQLLVREPVPGVDLQYPGDRFYIYPEQSKKIKITAVRKDGHKEEIPLRMTSAPVGTGLEPVRAVVAPESTSAEFELTAWRSAVGAHAPVTVPGAWTTAKISSGGGEGAAYARIDTPWLVIAEKPLFSLECAATSVNLVKGGTAELKVMLRRAPEFSGALRFHAENLPAGITLEGANEEAEIATLRFRAAPTVVAGRVPRIVIAATGAGQTNMAPKISFVVD
jgi:hypothetical protein